MKLTISGLFLVLLSSVFASDKEEIGVQIQKKVAGQRYKMKNCLNYQGRQVYPPFKIKFAIRNGKAQDISLSDAPFKDQEVTCIEGVLKAIDFSDFKDAQVLQNVNFKSKGGT